MWINVFAKMIETKFLIKKSLNLVSKRYLAIKPIKTKIKGHSSKQWILRQMADPYVEKAKQMNYRCRSAFKLMEIDEKFNIIKPGNIVLDCGAAPGSWTQVAVEKANSINEGKKSSKGLVVSFDLLPFQPIVGAKVLGNADITKPETLEKIRNFLQGRLVNCVLSDIAPNATGIKNLDHDSIVNICFHVLRFSSMISKERANILMKAWDGHSLQNLEKEMSRTYESVRRIKPKSSRQDSAEIYLLGQNFKRSLTI